MYSSVLTLLNLSIISSRHARLSTTVRLSGPEAVTSTTTCDDDDDDEDDDG